jgi:E3 ubiquitin-protein ligase UHRF1
VGDEASYIIIWHSYPLKCLKTYRAECSTDAIHAPFVAGISGDPKEGAYSVALSGGYDDDVDLGYALYVQFTVNCSRLINLFLSTYTGCGGRDLKGTKDAPKNVCRMDRRD